jgi:hypothetical protein
MPNTPRPTDPRPENKTLFIESQLLFVTNETALIVTKLTGTITPKDGFQNFRNVDRSENKGYNIMKFIHTNS